MALITEDGTGKSTAESYASVATLDAYAAAMGGSTGSADTTAKEQALRRATSWLDATYGSRFIGAYRVQITQALVFPLVGLVDAFGYIVASTSVPKQIVNATCEAAIREIASPGSLSPDVTTGKIKKRAKVGDIEVEYATGSAGADSQMPILTVVDGILANLIPGGSRNAYSGKAVRG